VSNLLVLNSDSTIPVSHLSDALGIPGESLDWILGGRTTSWTLGSRNNQWVLSTRVNIWDLADRNKSSILEERPTTWTFTK